MARPHSFRLVSRSTARRSGAAYMAGSRISITGEIAFTARKTGRRIVLPLVQPLSDYLASLPVSDNPNAFIFPNSAKHKRTASLSNQFRGILVDAGLVGPLDSSEALTKVEVEARETERDFVSPFTPLSGNHAQSERALGLHRARDYGHESAAVSRRYSTLSTDEKRKAMRQLPDVTSG